MNNNKLFCNMTDCNYTNHHSQSAQAEFVIDKGKMLKHEHNMQLLV